MVRQIDNKPLKWFLLNVITIGSSSFGRGHVHHTILVVILYLFFCVCVCLCYCFVRVFFFIIIVMSQQKKVLCEGCERGGCSKASARCTNEGVSLCCRCHRMRSHNRFWDMLAKDFACETCKKREFLCNQSTCGNTWCEMFNWNDVMSAYCCLCDATSGPRNESPCDVPEWRDKTPCDECAKYKKLLESLAKVRSSPKVARRKSDRCKRTRSYSDNALSGSRVLDGYAK